VTTPKDTQAAHAARRHWRVSLGATLCVLLLSATVSFVPPMLAYRQHRGAAAATIAGMPWPYFIGAQGAVLVFVLLVIGYTMVMSRADRRYRETMRSLGETENADDVAGFVDYPEAGARDGEAVK
jgi:putative solute:sodium symporter small subunit